MLSNQKDGGLQTTPWKINMEPTNHPFRKENDLNQTFIVMFQPLIFRGVPRIISSSLTSRKNNNFGFFRSCLVWEPLKDVDAKDQPWRNWHLCNLSHHKPSRIFQEVEKGVSPYESDTYIVFDSFWKTKPIRIYTIFSIYDISAKELKELCIYFCHLYLYLQQITYWQTIVLSKTRTS